MGESTSGYGYSYKKDPKIVNEDTWSDSDESAHKEINESCLMAFGSQEVYLNPSCSNKALNIDDLKNDNFELIKLNNDYIREIKALLRDKHSLQQETNKLAKRAKELELEFDENKGIKTKEVVEPCLSCEKLTHVVDSLKDDVLRLQDESLSFLKFKKSSDTLDHMLSQQKSSQYKKGLGFSKSKKTTFESLSKPIMFVKESHNGDSSNIHFKPIIP
ncbi:hypothetical protein Tco_1017448 [Tanacetum coccineum]|uniref:Uncharacterized protein n=1 Tax=Tanacetum coccineum TaxID=301880 RepID=A0ABQ5FRG9_9ASTR